MMSKTGNSADRPLVSIIIPCWNAEAYVGEAIESALGQTYSNVEVIVIDDGSTDKCLEVIRAFGSRVRFETGPNRGGSAARNRGLALAQGRLVQFLDADDLLHPEKLARQIPLVVQTPKAIVYSDYVVVDMISNVAVEVPRNQLHQEDAVIFALERQRLNTMAPIHWKKRLVAIGGFTETLPCAQEYDLHCRLACEGIEWLHLPDVLHVCRKVEHSVSSNVIRVVDQHASIVLKLHDRLARKGELTSKRRAALATVLASGARVYLRHGHTRRARAYFGIAHAISGRDGIRGAYSPSTRFLRRMLGARLTESLVLRKRNFGASRAIDTECTKGCKGYKAQ